MEDEPLKAQAAADRLGVSTATLKRYPRTVLPYWTTPGGHRRYRREDVEKARNATGEKTPAGAV